MALKIHSFFCVSLVSIVILISGCAASPSTSSGGKSYSLTLEGCSWVDDPSGTPYEGEFTAELVNTGPTIPSNLYTVLCIIAANQGGMSASQLIYSTTADVIVPEEIAAGLPSNYEIQYINAIGSLTTSSSDGNDYFYALGVVCDSIV